MIEKVSSAIEHINLNIATFDNVSVDDLSYINIFYGNNGTGKSSIVRAIKSGNSESNNSLLRWANGTSESDFDILIYNQSFIDRNFSSYDNLRGVFTLDEENIEIKKEIDEKTKKRSEIDEKALNCTDQIRVNEAKKEKAVDSFQDICWKLTSEIRTNFSDALEGKKTKKGLSDAVLKEQHPMEHDLVQLKQLFDVAFDSSTTTYSTFVKGPELESYNLPGRELLGVSIKSSDKTEFSRFINALNALDWVKTGHHEYAHGANGRCPYCQQELPDSFEDDLRSCFDEQYQRDIESLREFSDLYEDETTALHLMLMSNIENAMPSLDLSVYRSKVDLLAGKLEANRRILAQKHNEPAKSIELEDIDSLLKEIYKLIDEFNTKIQINNDAVNARRESKKKCRTDIMQHIAFVLRDSIKKYRTEIKEYNRRIKELEIEFEELIEIKSDFSVEIAMLNEQTVNTDGAIIGINTILRDAGFQGFTLRSKEGVANTYEVIRENGCIADNLSEGERNFIAFLYFYHLVRGRHTRDEVKSKIVILDDPVSSMDSSALFLVATIVREMMESCRKDGAKEGADAPANRIRQMFVLTHNVYFHREISYKQVDKYRSTTFYLIKKIDNKSSIKSCVRNSRSVAGEKENYSPVHSSYSVLWDELDEMTKPIPALNLMRRILEYYFLQLCGYDGIDLREHVLNHNRDRFVKIRNNGEIDMTDYYLASSMLIYINNPQSMSDGLNYVEECEDAEPYKRIFKRIFEAMGQDQHYRMMTERWETQV